MLTREQIVETERVRNAQNQRIHETFAARAKGTAAYAAWKDACRTWHSSELPADLLWSSEFRQRVRSGDRDAIRDAILYLEVDPWYFRSGYLKERLLEDLKRAPLLEEDKERLRRVVLAVIHGRNRRELQYFCHLAAVVADDEFQKALAIDAKQHDLQSDGKISYMLRYLKKHRRDPDRD